MEKLVLKPGREKSILNRHPWIFSGAVDKWPQRAAGDVVQVQSAKGENLGLAYVNCDCSLAARVLSFESGAPLEKLLQENMSRAIDLRRKLGFMGEHSACRLINAEADNFPGLVVDRYGGVLVLQIGTLGMEKLKSRVVKLLQDELKPLCIYEKSNALSRKEEGLVPQEGILYGAFPEKLEIIEDGARFEVDVRAGQKTGLFLDQREMRLFLKSLAAQKRVLNCFCYTGTFSVQAILGGALQVVSVDSSKAALESAKRNFGLNGINTGAHSFIEADVFDFLPQLTERFDIIVLDPPALAKRRDNIKTAWKAYEELNAQAVRRLVPGGLLFSSSCSYFVSNQAFEKIIFGAARKAGRHVRLLQRHRLALDHGLTPFHPEGEYLKSAVLQAE